MTDLQKPNKGRGRPAKSNTSEELQRAKDERVERKTDRVSMARGKKLDFKLKDGYVGRWANGNVQGRLERLEKAGYEFVKIDGQNVTTPSGAGKLYLMQVPKEFYDEDVAQGQQLITDVTRKKIAAPLHQDEYLPEGHTAALMREKDLPV